MQKSDKEDVVFGKVIRDLRLKASKSQEDLGLDCGLTRNFISLLELGQRRPTLKTLIKLSRGLKIDISDIMSAFECEFKRQYNRSLQDE